VLLEVSDAGEGGRVAVTGNLVPEGDEDWYQVTGVDDVQSDEAIDGCDNYDLRVRFTAQPLGVVFDVLTDSCTDVGCQQENLYQRRTNGRWGANGECPCTMINTAGQNLCTRQDHTLYIRVYRLAGFQVTSESYTVEIVNGMVL
jgi:hypothetical protein